MWLKFYTNHGQKLQMVDFKNKKLEDAYELADDKTFQLIVIDSLFVIGKEGNIIIDQNPKTGDLVKEGRKVYVTVTKSNPDKIFVSELPALYGNDFAQKSLELKNRGILSKIKSKKYDPGDPNHILEVFYNGELIIDQTIVKKDVAIDKGSTLEFVISNKTDGEILIPDLNCLTLSEADFMLSGNQLLLGEITYKGSTKDSSSVYIIDQLPAYDGVSKIPINSKVNLTVVSIKPSKCK